MLAGNQCKSLVGGTATVFKDLLAGLLYQSKIESQGQKDGVLSV